uniref:Aminotransferase class V domain-containing protein n=1 Tax=Panagrolaimus davidi TaxID=227884 RepID=A0A914Q7U7_9BILA
MEQMSRIYLDHAGATLPSEAQIKEISENLMKDVFRLGNPHSRHQSGETTLDIIKQVKECILTHFGVNSEEYSVIFTKNTSDSLKIMAEIVLNIFDKKAENKKLLICDDSHTSVHGIRHQLTNWKTTVKLFETITSKKNVDPFDLFILTAMSNFTGKKYDKNIIIKLKESNPNILICADLASLCGTSPINFKDFYFPDFVALSFYKIFGYPTGIGALIIKKSAKMEKFSPKGFFGGSVNFYNIETGEFILKENFEEK